MTTAVVTTSAAAVLADAGVRLREAFTGVLLPPRANGQTVNVLDGPPDQVAGLPAAWPELHAGRRGDTTTGTNTAIVRYLIVPPAQPNEALSASVAAAVDALEATRIPGNWVWSLQSIQIGGVDRDVIVFDVPTIYTATC